MAALSTRTAAAAASPRPTAQPRRRCYVQHWTQLALAQQTLRRSRCTAPAHRLATPLKWGPWAQRWQVAAGWSASSAWCPARCGQRQAGALPPTCCAPAQVPPPLLLRTQSCYGHTEGTAGLTGALLATTALQQQRLPPIVNLREVNPYVSAALSDWRTRQALAAMPPRQAAPAPLLAATAGPMLAGTSSFGMSGVNAHALLATGTGAPDAVISPPPWERTTFWPHATPHPLLLMVLSRLNTRGGSTVEFAVDLAAPGLAWLHDHRVAERALLPAAALFELAGASVAACSSVEGGSNRSAALQDAAILAPCVVPQHGTPMLLRCTMDGISGRLQVVGGTTKHVAAAATLTAPAPASAAAQAHAAAGVAAALIAPSLPARAGGHNLAAVALDRQSASGYFMHPAALDSCIHLAPVPAAGQPIPVTRVPVAAACLTLPPAAAQARLNGWAGAESVSIAADQSAESNMRWRGTSPTGASMLLAGLAARAITGGGGGAAGAAPSLAAVRLTYSVEWQVESADAATLVLTSTAQQTPPRPLVDMPGCTLALRVPHSNFEDARLAASFLTLVQQVRTGALTICV